MDYISKKVCTWSQLFSEPHELCKSVPREFNSEWTPSHRAELQKSKSPGFFCYSFQILSVSQKNLKSINSKQWQIMSLCIQNLKHQCKEMFGSHFIISIRIWLNAYTINAGLFKTSVQTVNSALMFNNETKTWKVMSVSLTASLMIDLQMLYLSHNHRQSPHAFLISPLFTSVEGQLTL